MSQFTLAASVMIGALPVAAGLAAAPPSDGVAAAPSGVTAIVGPCDPPPLNATTAPITSPSTTGMAKKIASRAMRLRSLRRRHADRCLLAINPPPRCAPSPPREEARPGRRADAGKSRISIPYTVGSCRNLASSIARVSVCYNRVIARDDYAATGPTRGSTMTEAERGLRERQEAETRATIRSCALRLIREQGYDATTIEQIVEAADVSEATFFRYFPAKEDVALDRGYERTADRGLPGGAARGHPGAGLAGGLRRRLRRPVRAPRGPSSANFGLPWTLYAIPRLRSDPDRAGSSRPCD